MSQPNLKYRECERGHVFIIPKPLREYLKKGFTALVICPMCDSHITWIIEKKEYDKVKRRGYSFME